MKTIFLSLSVVVYRYWSLLSIKEGIATGKSPVHRVHSRLTCHNAALGDKPTAEPRRGWKWQTHTLSCSHTDVTNMMYDFPEGKFILGIHMSKYVLIMEDGCPTWQNALVSLSESVCHSQDHGQIMKPWAPGPGHTHTHTQTPLGVYIYILPTMCWILRSN